MSEINRQLIHAKYHWEMFGDIPVDDDGNLDVDFKVDRYVFEKGTDREEVWHWFEDRFNVSVAKDLMGL